jgi:hypothetical protein
MKRLTHPFSTITAVLLCLTFLGSPRSISIGQEPAEEKVYSGPQPGESLTPFTLRGVLDNQAGVEFDPVTAANKKPLVLCFVHQANRPSIGMTRILMNYLESRTPRDVESCIIWLTADPTQAENDLKRMRHALPANTKLGIYTEGLEGPGSYGLNRQVTMTILISQENKVTANYALIQPSLQTDLPKIIQSIIDVAGGEKPDLAKLIAPPMQRSSDATMPKPATDPLLMDQVRSYLRPLIQKDATDAQVDQAAKTIETWIEENEAARKEIARISRTIVNGGKLDNYGTPRAQDVLKRWATKYNPSSDRP